MQLELCGRLLGNAMEEQFKCRERNAQPGREKYISIYLRSELSPCLGKEQLKRVWGFGGVGRETFQRFQSFKWSSSDLKEQTRE